MFYLISINVWAWPDTNRSDWYQGRDKSIVIIFFFFFLQRSTDSEIDEEEADIDLAIIEREFARFEDTLRSTDDTEANQHEAKGGENLIQEALKVRARN